jgi:hypothetical protein
MGELIRNSDPTIGATVNALARLGFYTTLKNPVGLYMDHIDLSGWETPDGGGVEDFIRIERGSPGMIERLVVEVPKKRRFALSDVTLAGEPIRYGGQVAECITVKLIGRANITSSPQLSPASIGKDSFFIDPHYPNLVVKSNVGTIPAYVDEGFERTEARISAFKTKQVKQPKQRTHSCKARKESV